MLKHCPMFCLMYVPFIIFQDHVCKTGYTLVTRFGHNQICGTQQSESDGEVSLGGPGWPSNTATDRESEEACRNECNARSDCAYYMWWNNKGCRLQTGCEETVDGYSEVISYICKKGKIILDIHYNYK